MVSIPNYVTKNLQKIQHPTPRRAQYAPHHWMRPNYSATKQLENRIYNPPPISEECKLSIKQIVRTFLYYDRTVGCTILPDLNAISDQ